MGCDKSQWSRLEVEVVNGKSQATGCRSVSPLRIVNPGNRERSCQVLLSNFGGGMVDGDEIRLQVVCRKGSSLRIGSVGSLQVYRSSNKGCSQAMTGILEQGALAVIEPDPVALHEGSRFRQKHHWQLETGANLLLAECLSGGRVENDERFAFLEYVSEFTAELDGRTVIHDRFAFHPEVFDYQDPALFGEFTTFLTIFMVGTGWESLASAVTDAIAVDSDGRGRPLLASQHPLEDHGYVVRALAEKSMHLAPLLERVHQTLSSDQYLGFNPRLRKY